MQNMDPDAEVNCTTQINQDMTNDPLEVVPAENSAYIIIGEPPKKFGIAWIEDGKNIANLKTPVDEKAL